MLTPSWDTVRLFLHVLGAAVWVGGQLTVAGLVPGLRERDPELPRLVARRFAKIAWGGFVLLLITGIWNLLAIDVGETSTAFQVTLAVKLAVVALTGVGAAAHSFARSKVGLAIWGAVGLLAGLAAVFVGILMTGG
jgi:putative copper export protein